MDEVQQKYAKLEELSAYLDKNMIDVITSQYEYKEHDTRTIIEIINSKSSFKASQEDLSDMLNKLKSCVNINDLPLIKNENGEFVGFEMLQKNIAKEKGKLSKLARKIDYQNTPKIFAQKK